MYKSLLSCSALALLCTGFFAQADTTPIDQTFFSVGGPNKAAAAVNPAPANKNVVESAPNTTEKLPAPMPDPALFTQVKNLSEQTSDNAVDIFGLGRRAQAKAASANTTNGTTTTGTTVTTANQPTQPNMPDPSLFTNPGTPNEQTRDHPFKLF